jgi:phenylacetate-CoA ligase
MSLRRLSAAEYAINLVAVTVLWPVYGRREWGDRASIERFALRRAVEMATHAGATTPVYRDRYRAAGVDPAAITDWAGFARLPIVDKSVILGDPTGSLAAGSDLSRCLLSTSSGSSGVMLSIPHRADRFWPYLLSSQRILRWAAGGRYPFWWRQAYVYTSEYPLLRVPGFYPLTFIPTAADPDRILAALEGLRPQLLHTYPSVLRDLVGLAPDRLRALQFKGVSVGSESSTQAERDGWEAQLGAPVRDEYSSEELGRIASQCPEGRYHLHEDIVRAEIVDADDQPTRDVGEVVGTELHNRTMPFVRYRQGDLARISDEPCPCGRRTRLLVDLVGRRNDGFLLDDGRTLAPGFLLDASYRAVLGLAQDAVASYRFRQEGLAEAVFEVVRGPGWSAATPAAIERSLRSELPPVLHIRVAVVDAIDRSAGGKRSTIVRDF